MSMVDARRELIAAAPWFAGLPDDALDRLAAAAVVESRPVNSLLYALGRPTTEVYCIISGRVRLSISSPQGHEFALVDREQGTWLGEPGLVNDEGRILEARVIEAAEVLVIPRAVVLAVGEAHPLMYRNLFHYYHGILRDFHALVGGILFYPLRARVAGRLLALAEEHGEAVADGVRIDIKVSQNDFARLALASRQHVNKVFREWNARGVVETRDDHLLIRDLAALQAEIDASE
jgi:CRP-like cAMP-binding protein